MNTEEIPNIFASLSKPLTSKKNHTKVLAVLSVFFVLLVIATCYGFYHAFRSKSRTEKSTVVQNAEQEEAKNLVTEVSRIMILPSDEVPTVATVTEIEHLKDQPFFQKAQNGNKVLIFLTAKVAILYDPVAKKIVNIGPLNIADTQAHSPTPAPPQAKIILRNGTSIAKLATATESELQKVFPGSDIEKKEQASNNNYEKTLVIALSPAAATSATTLAQFFHVTLAELPPEEIKPEGMDILVILGKDRASPTPMVSP